MAPKSKAKAKAKNKHVMNARAKATAKKSAPKKRPAKPSAKKKSAATKSGAKNAPITSRAARTPGAPTGYRSITPYLVIEGANKALDFYSKAFGAEVVMKLATPDGRLCHAEIRIGDSMIMLSDDFPEMNGGKSRSPIKLGGTPVSVHIYVPNSDRTFDRAVAAGCTALMPLTDMFWGDRFGMVTDPYGHMWSIATNVEELSPAEVERAMHEFMAQQQGACSMEPAAENAPVHA